MWATSSVPAASKTGETRLPQMVMANFNVILHLFELKRIAKPVPG
jgi:hypothetical protein